MQGLKTHLLFAAALTLASCAFPTFVRKDGSDVYLSGQLRAGDSAKLAKLVGPETRRLIVRSSGGTMGEAFDIAELIRKHDLSIKVDRYCASACASVLFIAARVRELPNDAFLAFHASPQELALRNASGDIAKQLGSDEQKVREMVKIMGARFEALFRSAGVWPELNEKLVFIAGWTPATTRVTAVEVLPGDNFNFTFHYDACGMLGWVPDEDGLARIGIKLSKPYVRPDKEKIAGMMGMKANQLLFNTIDDLQEISCEKDIRDLQKSGISQHKGGVRSPPRAYVFKRQAQPSSPDQYSPQPCRARRPD